MMIRRVIVGSRRWEQLATLPAGKPIALFGSSCIPVPDVLAAVEVVRLPELEPDDAFIEFEDGSVQRL